MKGVFAAPAKVYSNSKACANQLLQVEAAFQQSALTSSALRPSPQLHSTVLITVLGRCWRQSDSLPTLVTATGFPVGAALQRICQAAVCSHISLTAALISSVAHQTSSGA